MVVYSTRLDSGIPYCRTVRFAHSEEFIMEKVHLQIAALIFAASALLQGCASAPGEVEASTSQAPGMVTSQKVVAPAISATPLQIGEGFEYRLGSGDLATTEVKVLERRDLDGKLHFSNGDIIAPNGATIRTGDFVGTPHMGNQFFDKNTLGEKWHVSYEEKQISSPLRGKSRTRDCKVTYVGPKTVAAGTFVVKVIECDRWVNGHNYPTIAYVDLKTQMPVFSDSPNSNGNTGKKREAIRKIEPPTTMKTAVVEKQ